MAGPELYGEPVLDWFRPMAEAELLRPTSLDGALAALVQYPEAKINAGGTYYLRLARFGGECAPVLVDLGLIEQLHEITVLPANRLRIGSMVVHARMTGPEVRPHVPLLAEAARRIAGPAVRNLATVGGNVIIGWDLMPPLLAQNTVVDIVSREGSRRVRLEDFRDGGVEPLLEHGEIVTAFEVDFGLNAVGYARVARRKAVSRAIASAAVTWRVADGAAHDVRVAVGSTNFVARRVPEAETLLEGRAPSMEVIEVMGSAAYEVIDNTFESFEAEGWYARQMAKVMTVRAATQAARGTRDERNAR